MRIVLRPASPADATACGRICYEAFKALAEAHNFPSDWPSLDTAVTSIARIIRHPGFYGVVAEEKGRVIGSCFLDERAAIAGLGPITVDPEFQGGSVGRHLMQHVLDRTDHGGRDGVRLVQAAYNNRSLSLYAKLGFEVREPLCVMQGAAIAKEGRGDRVRKAVTSDLGACNELCLETHGYNRSRELEEAIDGGTAIVVEGEHRICGYATLVGFRGHAVGETNTALQALIGSAGKFSGAGFLLPSRNGELFRWCLDGGLRVVETMTYMSRGWYQEPKGVFLPSILA